MVLETIKRKGKKNSVNILDKKKKKLLTGQ